MKRSLHDCIVFSDDVNKINSPAFYDCVVHLICTGGTASFLYNRQEFSLSEGRIAVITQPRFVKIKEESDDFQCEYIAAPGKFLHNLLPANNYSIQGCVSLFSNPIIEVSDTDAEKFHTDLRNICQRLDNSEHRFYTEMIGGLLQTMIYDLFDFHIRNNENILTTDRIGYITSRFFAMIEAGHPKTQRDVAHYAKEMNVTSKYLSDTIKRVTGQSITSHINNAAASVIIEYLNANRLSITQIADEMNFTSVSYFSRYCTKHIGMSPARYRLAGLKG